MKVLHSLFVLRRKRNQCGKIEKYKAREAIRKIKESDNDNDYFSSVVDYTLTKWLLCLAVHRKWEVKHFDFHNAFSNGNLYRPVYAELPQHIFFDVKSKSVVMMFQHSFYGLKDASKIWFELVKEKFEATKIR